jgi:Na+-translocating ferredoxin:NAD+ oxidoreductase RnfG subunit
MKTFLKFLLLVSLIVASGAVGTAGAQSRKVKRAEAKAEKQKERQWNAVLESQKKDKKRRYEMQTSDTKKRMKATKNSSKRINDQDRKPFLKKLFHRKKR